VTKAVSSSGFGLNRITTKSHHDLVTAHNKAPSNLNPAWPIAERYVENPRKRKSTQGHEAVTRSRQPEINLPIINDAICSRVQARIPGTLDGQIREEPSASSLEGRNAIARTPFAESMVACSESALSKLPKHSQHSINETMHESSDAEPIDDQSDYAKRFDDVYTARTAAWLRHPLADIRAGTSARFCIRAPASAPVQALADVAPTATSTARAITRKTASALLRPCSGALDKSMKRRYGTRSPEALAKRIQKNIEHNARRDAKGTGELIRIGRPQRS